MAIDPRLPIQIPGQKVDTAVFLRRVVKRDPDRQVGGMIEPHIGPVLMPGETRPLACALHHELFVEKVPLGPKTGPGNRPDLLRQKEGLDLREFLVAMRKEPAGLSQPDLVTIAAPVIDGLVKKRVTGPAQHGKLLAGQGPGEHGISLPAEIKVRHLVVSHSLTLHIAAVRGKIFAMERQEIAKSVAPHPEVSAAPHALCWRRSDRRRYGAGPQAHAELVAFLGLRGDADYLLDGHAHPLRRGTLIWAFAGQAHVLLRDSADFDMWVFLVSGRLLPGDEAGLPPLHVSQRGPVAPRELPDRAIRDLDRLAEAARDAPTAPARGAGIRWWLTRAWAAWQAAEDAGSRAIHPAVARAAGLLRDDPTLPMDELARRAGLSHGRLARLFRAETGQGIVDYRTQQKLGRVEAALEDGERNLTRAALDAGFGSYSQFYRAFRAARGVEPRAGLLRPPA